MIISVVLVFALIFDRIPAQLINESYWWFFVPLVASGTSAVVLTQLLLIGSLFGRKKNFSLSELSDKTLKQILREIDGR